jgi:hypothetical protein
MNNIFRLSLMKMNTELQDEVHYYLLQDSERIHLNECLGKPISIEFLGEIHCIRCGKRTNKSFAQGYCYPCMVNAPETSECVLRPELCQAHEGISRDMKWSEDHCLQDHIVYLALTSGLKVGVTRSSQVPTRWIDQGAWRTIRFARTHNRCTAGLIEVSLKKHMNDKTNWRKMLTNQMNTEIDLLHEKSEAADLLSPELRNFVINEDEIIELNYPVLLYPEKVSSLSLDKEPGIEGILSGIRGQYLIFNDGRVLNIRKHNGYLVEMRY